MDIGRVGHLASTEITENGLIHDLQQLLAETRQSAENFTIEQIVEAALLKDSSVDACMVLERETETSELELVAYVVTSKPFSPIQLQSHLQTVLPAVLVPSAYVLVSTLPLTPTGQVDKQVLARHFVIDSDLVQLQSLPEVGKVDLRALPNPEGIRSELSAAYVPTTEVEQTIAAVWQEVLHLEQVGIHNNFFDLGGDSLLLTQVNKQLINVFNRDISITKLFKYPTINSLANYLKLESNEPPDFPKYFPIQAAKACSQSTTANSPTKINQNNSPPKTSIKGIAIIGMSGRFPGAKNIDDFWHNLRNGVESVSFFTEQELEQSGVEPAVLSDPSYVKAKAVLEDVELFDASFFGFSPREAEMMDPQHRFFLECAWDALESAGYDPDTYEGGIGVYAGSSMSTYFFNLYSTPRQIGSTYFYQAVIGNDKDYLSTRVSYKLNLKGPSVTVQTACSTSLVAVHQACRGLLNYECDMALAGGVSINVPHQAGHYYQEGGMFSPDGHCRAFDAKAQGMVIGNGVGIVVLKRLADALADGDSIYAVIKGSAINNDGSKKVGYTAPSVDGQAEVIAMAQALAEVEPETITYIEAHGTGTPVGDPIEIDALTQAFSRQTENKGFCAIGSVKTNVGHLYVAAGVTSLIKTVLALKHELLPPSLHFFEPNPRIDFANSPFYVNATLSEWQAGSTPRRAGVSSFGVGGTNAHVVLEEAPIVETSGESRPSQLLVLSATTSSALDTATKNLVEHLKQHPSLNFADVAYTYQVGRKAFSYRRILVCDQLDDAVALLTLAPQRVKTSFCESRERTVVFMFPGQGAQYVNMALELYQVEPVFREQVDICSELLLPHLGLDLRQVFYPTVAQANGSGQDTRSTQLEQTAITQPALFVIEYALAKLWMQWGVRPQAMIGHSIGEYVAACLAGVFSLEDALALVAARGQLMQLLPGGDMIAVPLQASEVQPLLGKQLSLAAINGPSLCVVSGSKDAVEQLVGKLSEQGIQCRRLHTSHAFHSEMMEPILGRFTEQVKKVNLQPPKIPYVSNVTGAWITVAEATNPNYWARHLRDCVLFEAGLHELLKQPQRVLLEVGPGQTLSTLARRHPNKSTEQVVLSCVRHPHDQHSDVEYLLNTLGQLWLAGIQVDWSGFYAHERRRRLPLPTYPFERQRYWIEPPNQVDAVDTCQVSLHNKPVDSSSLHARPSLQNVYFAPNNDVEQKIADVWQGLLGIRKVGIYDNFFELGGDSLVAVRLFAQIKKIFGKDLPLATLFEAPTVEKLATILQQEGWSAPWSSLVPIQPGGDKPPLFAVHAAGGGVFFYRDLARHLGPDQPFYGLQAQGLDGKQAPHHRVEDMAAHYIREIRSIQPEGPYFIGGFSFGSAVAFEMAQQLHAQGQKVALLALFDGWHPKLITSEPTLTFRQKVSYHLAVLSGHLSTLSRLEPQAKLRYVLDKVLDKVQRRTQQRIKAATDTGTSHIKEALGQALRNYVTQVYPGCVTLFRASMGLYRWYDPQLGWGEVAAGGLEIYVVPGHHGHETTGAIFKEPNVQILAKQLRACLDKAQAAEE